MSHTWICLGPDSLCTTCEQWQTDIDDKDCIGSAPSQQMNFPLMDLGNNPFFGPEDSKKWEKTLATGTGNLWSTLNEKGLSGRCNRSLAKMDIMNSPDQKQRSPTARKTKPVLWERDLSIK